MRLPDIIIAIDWSSQPSARSLTQVKLSLDSGSYEVDETPQVVLSPKTLINHFKAQTAVGAVVLVGFDFPIGLPRAYAVNLQLRNFRAALEEFDKNLAWSQFYVPTDHPTPHQPFSPSNPTSRLKRAELASAIGLTSDGDLLRLCDRRTATRYQAESVFYLRFAKQVGRSAIEGWQEIISPMRREVRIWPFDAPLAKLLLEPGLVITEIYPAEATTQLGLPLGPGTGKSKRRREDRARCREILQAAAESSNIVLSQTVRQTIDGGFESEHHFDSFVALLSMVQVVQGKLPCDLPDDESVQSIEGWILGQDPHLYLPPTAVRAHIRMKPTARPFRPSYRMHRVWCGSDESKHLIELAYPKEDGKGAINVLCGPNNSGKSFSLDQIYRIIKRKKHRGVIRVEPAAKLQPRVLFFGKAWNDKEKIGIVNLDQTAKGLSVAGQHGDYLRSGLSFLLRQMAPHLPGMSAQDLMQRVIEPEVRETIAAAFEIQSEVYLCDEDDPLVQRLQRALGGTLYFRCLKRDKKAFAWQFEFDLVYGNGTTLPYEMWSDGQRALFYVLVSLEHFRPEIVLYDEAENHLHPAFMSEILEHLRSLPIQSLIVTHHPHLVFSRFADKVFYIETDHPKPHAIPPKHLPFTAQYFDFDRRIGQLRGNFEKIASSYRLFSHQDAQLLAQAEYVKNRSSLILASALGALFSYPPIPESKRPLPDTQSQQLADRIRNFAGLHDHKTVEILDLGAGLGRQVRELAKLSDYQLHSDLSWTCFEPIPTNFALLQERFNGTPVRVCPNLAELRKQKFHFSVLANVLHELTPPEFAAYLRAADEHTSNKGGILVLELFPLLHPEGYAVPYPPTKLQEILDKAGYSVDIAQVSLPQSATTAYCLMARRRGPSIRWTKIPAIIQSAWQSLVDGALSAYSTRAVSDDMAGYQRLLSQLALVTSVTSWRTGRWLPAAPGIYAASNKRRALRPKRRSTK
jgi:energy-coupling factor transporter ATP-binding protein EcfA2